MVVGFSWDGADERKMRASFGSGRAGFGRFVDLSAVAEGLGYDQVGLATLTHRVLGTALPKLRSVCPRNPSTPPLQAGHHADTRMLASGCLLFVINGRWFQAMRRNRV